MGKDDAVSAYPVYGTMKQDLAGLERCGLYVAAIEGASLNWKDKYVFPLSSIAQNSIADTLRIKAILIPEVALADRTRFETAPPGDTFNALMPSTLQQLSGDRAARVAEAGQICRTLPAYRMALGKDPNEVAAAIDTFLGQA